MTLLTPRRLAAGLLLFGLIAGTLLDERPERPPTERAGYRLLEVDFHAHTRFSDGFLSPPGLVIQAQRRGLDALAVTEHNMVLPSRIAAAWSQATGGPTILTGEEITTSDFHLHAVGIRTAIDPELPLPAIIDEIHRQGGIAIAAHPVRHFWPAFEPVRGQLDAVELAHPIMFRRDGTSSWRWQDIVAFYRRAVAAGYDITPVASSDYHFFSPLGVCRTLVFATDDSSQAILEAVRAGRTVVYGFDGERWGPPELLAALDEEPYTLAEQDYHYRGRGPLDVLARSAGLLGLLGLLLLGSGGRSPTAATGPGPAPGTRDPA